MFNKLLQLIAPFSLIAKELAAIRELYEAELAAREKPVYRITESPKDNDTEVFYGEEKEKSKLRKLLDGLDPTEEDEP